MAFDLQSISREAQNLPPRILLLGLPKVGKTTWAASAPGAVLIPVKGEEGADAVTCAKFPTVQSYLDLCEALDTLANEKHDFKFVVIDSASALERLIWERACAIGLEENDKPKKTFKKIEDFGYGKGYTVANSVWVDLTHRLDKLRNAREMGCILIGHVSKAPFDDPMSMAYDEWVFSVHTTDKGGGARDILTRWVDSVLFAREKAYLKNVGDEKHPDYKGLGTGERVLLTQKRPGHPGGGRFPYGNLPYELPLDFHAWMNAVGVAMQKSNPNT